MNVNIYVTSLKGQIRKILSFRVPEDKCHMVLPEIEEEMEDEEEGQKLSLTSLLLGIE